MHGEAIVKGSRAEQRFEDKLCEELKERVRDLNVARSEAADGDVRPRDDDFSIFGGALHVASS